MESKQIDELVRQREQYRRDKMFKQADEIKKLLEENNITITDYSFKLGGNSEWRYTKSTPELSIIELAKEALSLDLLGMQKRLIEIVDLVKEQLRFIISQFGNVSLGVGDPHKEMCGRKYCDCAFYFAMCGVIDEDLFSLLLEGAINELQRIGLKKTCTIMTLLQMSEKLAVAGIRNQEYYQLTYSYINNKMSSHSTGVDSKHSSDLSLSLSVGGGYSLVSPRPPLALWRFTSKQHKFGRQEKSINNLPSAKTAEGSCQCQGVGAETANASDASGSGDLGPAERSGIQAPPLPPLCSLFDDPSLPLVLDLGCGYGVSLLGLCAHERALAPHHREEGRGGSDEEAGGTKRRRTVSGGTGYGLGECPCNYLGFDLSVRGIHYANGIAKRWGLSRKCAFVIADVNRALDWIASSQYAGGVSWILMQFPTPYSQLLMPRLLSPGGCISTVQPLHGHAGDNDGDREGEGGLSLSEPKGAGVEDVADVAPCCRDGNSQLPTALTDFMINHQCIAKCEQVLTQLNHSFKGKILVQSNVEDVSVTLRCMFESHSSVFGGHFKVLNFSQNTSTEVSSQDSTTMGVDGGGGGEGGERGEELQTLADESVLLDGAFAPLDGAGQGGGNLDGDGEGLALRAVKWRELGGPKAAGGGWIGHAVLPSNGITETEAMCNIFHKPVYRLVLELSSMTMQTVDL